MRIKPMGIILTMLARWLNGQQTEVIEYLLEENKILREKLGGKRILLTDQQRIRLAVLGKKLGRQVLSQFCGAFSPDTILGWHRKLVAIKYTGRPGRSKTGRPRISDEIRKQILQIAKECNTFGYDRITGYLNYLGYKVSSTTVERVLREHGFDLHPKRPDRTTWNEFIKAHWESLAATDFFTVEVFTMKGLTRYMVLFVIDIATRKVEISGVIKQANGQWMKQVAKNLVNPVDGFLKNKRYLIYYRDHLFTKKYSDILRAGGAKTIKTPRKSPNMNVYAERFIRTIKYECVYKMLFFGEKHLRYCLDEFCIHYNTERPHRSLGNKMIEPPPQPKDGKVVLCKRLGGLLKSYRRAA